jgi:hypothetical protein
VSALSIARSASVSCARAAHGWRARALFSSRSTVVGVVEAGGVAMYTQKRSAAEPLCARAALRWMRIQGARTRSAAPHADAVRPPVGTAALALQASGAAGATRRLRVAAFSTFASALRSRLAVLQRAHKKGHAACMPSQSASALCDIAAAHSTRSAHARRRTAGPRAAAGAPGGAASSPAALCASCPAVR